MSKSGTRKRPWLSLQQRLDLALHHLTVGLDWRPLVRGTALEGAPFCSLSMGERLVQIHASPDLTECPGRYLTALALCLDSNPSFAANGRSAMESADHLARYLDRRVNAQGKMEASEQEIAAIAGPDQVFLESPRGKGAAAIARGWWEAARGVNHSAFAGIALEGLVRWYLRTGDRAAEKTIHRMIRGKVTDPAHPAFQGGSCMLVPEVMSALLLYYEATGREEVRSYLEELAAFFLKEAFFKFFPDGKHSHGEAVGHLHTRFTGVTALARLGALLGRDEYLGAAEEILAVNAAYGAEFGWMPERHVFAHQSAIDSGIIYQPWAVSPGETIDFTHYARPRHGWDTCEICVTADAVDAAIFLARNGNEKYWDIAERYLNHVFESQIRDDSFVVERDRAPIAEKMGAKFENVREDMLGAFVSYTSPTWPVSRRQYPKMRPDGREGVREGKQYGVGVACCHGWGARTLGLVWRNIVTESGHRVEVNFPFDRRTEKVAVKSALPFVGNVAVTALKPVDLFVRIPDWVEHAKVEVRLNGKRRDKAEFRNQFSDYVKVGRVNPGEEAEITYPLRIEKKRYSIEYHPNLYEAEWLGNYVMGMKEIRVSRGQGDESFPGIGELYQYDSAPVPAGGAGREPTARAAAVSMASAQER